MGIWAYLNYLRVAHEDHLRVGAKFRVSLDHSSHGGDTLGLGRNIWVEKGRVVDSLDIRVRKTLLDVEGNSTDHACTSTLSRSSCDNHVKSGTMRFLGGGESHKGGEESEVWIHLEELFAIEIRLFVKDSISQPPTRFQGRVALPGSYILPFEV